MPSPEPNEEHLSEICADLRAVTEKARGMGASINDVMRGLLFEMGMIITAQYPGGSYEPSLEEAIAGLRKICPELRAHQEEHPDATH